MPLTKTKSVKRNMVMNILLTMSNFIFPLITFPYVSRILTPVGTGKVGFATSVVSYFAMFVQLGVPTYGIRACSKVRNDKEELSRIVHELMFINVFMTIVVYIFYGIALAAIPRLNNEFHLYLVLGISIFLNAIGVEWLYKGLEEYTYITIRSIIFKFIAFAATFIMIRAQKDYVLYGALTIFAASASNVLNFINLRKYIYVRPVGKYNIRRHIKMVLVFFAMSIATTIYTNLDKVMLGFMKDGIEGDIQVGYYDAAVKIKNILLSVVTSVSAVLLPRASYYVDKGQIGDFYRILRKTMHFIVMIAIAFSVYFVFFAKEGILFLSGKDYEGAIIPMQIIMPTLFLIGLTNVIGIQMLVPLGKEKQVLYSEIIGAVIDLILNAILIPPYGAAGAAIGTLVAEIGVLIWQIYSIKEVPVKIFLDVPWIKYIIAVMAASVSSIWIKILDFNSFITLVISAIFFFMVYGIVLLFMKDSILKEVVEILFKKLKHNKK